MMSDTNGSKTGFRTFEQSQIFPHGRLPHDYEQLHCPGQPCLKVLEDLAECSYGDDTIKVFESAGASLPVFYLRGAAYGLCANGVDHSFYGEFVAADGHVKVVVALPCKRHGIPKSDVAIYTQGTALGDEIEAVIAAMGEALTSLKSTGALR